MDADGNQKLDSSNRKQWKHEVTDATGWNNPKNCELWRSEWANECNLHLKKEQQIDHRSYERQGKIEIPTIHEGAEGRTIQLVSGAESKIAGIKQRVARAASHLAKYRGTVGIIGEEGRRNSDIEREKADDERRKSAMERISGEVELRKSVIAETERGIVELQNRLEKARDVDERLKKLKARRADGGNAGCVGEHGEGTDTERYNSSEEGQRDTNTTGATERIAELMREAEQREQSRERTSLKERIEVNKRIVAEREREKGRQYNKRISR